MTLDEAKLNIGKKVEFLQYENNEILRKEHVLKDVREVDNRFLCYFDDTFSIVNYTIIKVKEDNEKNT